MIPIAQTGQNFHRLLSTMCDAKYSANVRAFFMGNLDSDSWSLCNIYQTPLETVMGEMYRKKLRSRMQYSTFQSITDSA